ncbi:MAG TPA: lipoyl synthase [Chromatiaceae bacterium]|jgi:lipoic acid synthetase|nr:lipoyl synthase [Chromatiaceae bacterium]HIN81702.1 lipoyl synthase [Chromatiales bacterium]HIA08063.1 lipoyl synthase [Chromatiaceae bacterium]HIB83524.1 lipoyl synthase [Chromatiaceae bacterium]HIO14355.1 lipoyl synthase [Chromatiales bacterium]
MKQADNVNAPSRSSPDTHQRGFDKLSRIPVKIEPTLKPARKPAWIRTKLPTGPQVGRIKKILREANLHSVCEEANCPNLGECFSHGTATFMIMGDICTRRCPFCDVAHGRPKALDVDEPINLAKTIRRLGLKYVVITSVDRDDLRDGGATHYTECIRQVREYSPETRIEVLVPDFRGRMDRALEIFQDTPPDVFNHNLETIPKLYRECRPGSDYQWSLDLIKNFKANHPHVLTKSGLMLGLGEEADEIEQVLRDLRAHNCDMLTLGQYLQPSPHHLSVKRYVEPAEFDRLAEVARELGFSNVASGPMVRSSYHADQQAMEILARE